MTIITVFSRTSKRYMENRKLTPEDEEIKNEIKNEIKMRYLYLSIIHFIKEINTLTLLK